MGQGTSQSAKRPSPVRQGGQLRAAWLLVALLAGVILQLYSWQLSGLGPVGGERLWLLPLVAVGVWAADTQRVSIRKRGFSLALALDGIPVLVGIVFLLPAQVLLAVACGQLLAELQLRRPLARALHNALVYVVAVGAGVLVYDQGVGNVLPVSPRAWLFSAAAVAVIGVADLLGLLVVMALASGRWRHPPLFPMCEQAVLDVLICAAGGLVAVELVWVARAWGVALFVTFVAAADLGYRAAVRAGQRYADLERLYSFTQDLGHLREQRDVIAAVLEQARRLFSANRAELTLALGARWSSSRFTAACRATGRLSSRTLRLPGHLDLVVAERGPLLFAPGGGDDRLAGAMAARAG